MNTTSPHLADQRPPAPHPDCRWVLCELTDWSTPGHFCVWRESGWLREEAGKFVLYACHLGKQVGSRVFPLPQRSVDVWYEGEEEPRRIR